MPEECKYAMAAGTGAAWWYVCRLEGGAADPERCAGCRWRKEGDGDGEALAEQVRVQ